jgi:hypothetical protein
MELVLLSKKFSHGECQSIEFILGNYDSTIFNVLTKLLILSLFALFFLLRAIYGRKNNFLHSDI